MTFVTHNLCKGLNKAGLSDADKQLINQLVCSQQALLNNNVELTAKINDMLSAVETHYRAVDNGFTCEKSNAMIVDELNNLYDNICCLIHSITKGFFLIPKSVLVGSFQFIKGGISGLFNTLKYPAQFAILLKDLILRIVYTIGIKGHKYKQIEHFLDELIDWVPQFLDDLSKSLTDNKVSTFKLIGLKVLEVLAKTISARRGWFKKLIGSNLDKVIDALPIPPSTKAYLHNAINSNKEVLLEYIDVLIDTFCDEPEAFIEMIINYAILDNNAYIRQKITENNNDVSATIAELTYHLLNYIDLPNNVKVAIKDYICIYFKDETDELNTLYNGLLGMQVSPVDFSKRLSNIVFGCIKQIIIYLNQNYKEFKISPITFETLVKLIISQSKKHINNSKYSTILGSAEYLQRLMSSLIDIIKNNKQVTPDTLKEFYQKAVVKTNSLVEKMVDGFFDLSQENWAYTGYDSASDLRNKEIPKWKKSLKHNINRVEHSILNFLPCFLKKFIYRALFFINSLLKLICDNFGELLGVLLFLTLLIGIPLFLIILPLILLAILTITLLLLALLALVSALIGALIGALISGIIFGLLGLLGGTIFGFGLGNITGFILGFILGFTLGTILGLALGFIAGLALGVFLGASVTALISYGIFSLITIGFLISLTILTFVGLGAGITIGTVIGAILAWIWHIFAGSMVRFVAYIVLFFISLIIMVIVGAIVGAVFNSVWLPFSIVLLNAFPNIVIGEIPIIGPILGFFGSTLGTVLQAIGAFIASAIAILIGLIIVFVIIYIAETLMGLLLL